MQQLALDRRGMQGLVDDLDQLYHDLRMWEARMKLKAPAAEEGTDDLDRAVLRRRGF